jgi:dihydropyrimidine dehydrogenase (NAD+) subunit PreT
MSEKKQPKNHERSSRAERFTEYHPPYTEREALLESNRCLYCHDAPCIVACPTHIDIPSFIKKISTNNLKGSARTILQSNILGATCSRVCPVEELCEGACVLNADEKPITIGRLQRHAMDYANRQKIKFFEKGNPNGFRVAIIGAGPAGLACGTELAKEGFEVVCFEKKPLSGGLDTYGIVVFREPVEVSLAEVAMIEELGVEIRNNQAVGTDVVIGKLIDEFDAIFVGIGLGRVTSLNVPGLDLAGVYDGLDFIEETKTMDLDKIPCGEHVCVIGAGNTAIDCATIARRLGAPEVTIIYRRSRAEIPAYEFEYEFAAKEGINFRFLTQPLAVLGKGKVKALRCSKVELGAKDSSGRPKPQLVPGSEFEIACDTVITAIGQGKHDQFLSELVNMGIKLQDGYIVVDAKTNRTGHPKIFAGGDCIRAQGQASTVMAVEDGKIASQAIRAQLLSPNKNGKH